MKYPPNPSLKPGTRYKDLRSGKILTVTKVADGSIFFENDAGHSSCLSLEQFHLGSALVWL